MRTSRSRIAARPTRDFPQGHGRTIRFSTIGEMLETFAKQKFRLEVVAGFVYADSRVNAFIADPAFKDLIVPTGSDAHNFQNLLAGVTDGFLADRIAAATTAWRLHLGARIEEHPLASHRYSFHAQPRNPDTADVGASRRRHRRVARSGEFRRIAAFYALPVLINQTLDSEWFRVSPLSAPSRSLSPASCSPMRDNIHCSEP